MPQKTATELTLLPHNPLSPEWSTNITISHHHLSLQIQINSHFTHPLIFKAAEESCYESHKQPMSWTRLFILGPCVRLQ